MLKRIVSGGQTGADFGALRGAKGAGLKTGGFAPQGWRTEKGPRRILGTVYGLEQTLSWGYRVRTMSNVDISDGTLWIGKPPSMSPGGKLTHNTAMQFNKPWFKITRLSYNEGEPFDDKMSIQNSIGPLTYWIKLHRIVILNVAGNRESSNPGLERYTEELIIKLIEHLKND